jgi:membrane protein
MLKRYRLVRFQLKKSKLYKSYRKCRFLLHLSPRYKFIKGFLKHYFVGLYNRIDHHHVFLLGGGLAFSLFVCIIPFTLILFAVLGLILDSAHVQYQVNTLIDTIIPYYQYSEFVKKIIFSRIGEFIEYRNIAGIVGGFGLLVAASGLFSSMRTILNTVYGVEIEINIILAKLKDFALILMVLIIFFITTIIMPFIDLLRQKADSWEELSFLQSGIFGHFVFSILSLLLIFVVFTILYFAVPSKKIGKKAILISSLWAAILWEAAKQLFGYYIYNFSALGRIYGTYALVVVVAFWIYYSSIVFIIGAEIGRLFYERNYLKLLK